MTQRLTQPSRMVCFLVCAAAQSGTERPVHV